MMLTSEQADLHVASPLAQTENRVGGGVGAAEGVERKVGAAARDLVEA
jgi:hypothetical protein